MDELTITCVVIAAATIVGVLAFNVGEATERNKVRAEAIEAGVGEYFLNEEYQRDFRWIKTP